MASANSRRQEVAEAGRRKLEQFRKQKAAKKASQSSNTTTTEPVVDNSQRNVTDSDGAVAFMSNGPLKQSDETSTNTKSSFSGGVNNLSFSNIVANDGGKETSKKDDGYESVGKVDFSSSVELIDSSKDLTMNNRPEVVPYSYTDKQSSESFDRASTLRENDGVPKDTSPYRGSTVLSSSMQMDGFSYGSGLNSFREDSLQPTTRMAGSFQEVAKNQQGSGELRGGSIMQKPTLSSSYLFSSPVTASRPSESSDYSVNITSPSPFYSAKNEATVKRSRPSFLDSLNISRAPETQYQPPEVEAELVTSSGSQLTGSDGFGPSSFQYLSGKRDSNGPSLTSGASASPYASPYPYENVRSHLFPAANGVMPSFTDFSMPKQNDDFSALEQHIEDLTQEKFSLQRDLDASRALAESLASENSSMTDTYNQQRSIVNQLKDDLENLHQQIQAQMGELESVRIEYANAQLECNAADERSQILASEVISLEDKALRLRSNELKLERELENAKAEVSSYKKKLQSLEKDRQDLQSTIKALQEEKKVLQTMVQKGSLGGKSTDLGKSSTSRKNASTSTEGLAISDTMPESSNQETDSTALLESDSSNTAIIPETGQLTLEGFSLSVPADQMRVIHNINTLIAELALEKEELVQALSSELSRSAQVQELNKELSRKLEGQTKRLELLTAQRMAIDSVSPEKQQSDSHVVQERTPIADEGDEVVERVLGWIMKMFPGGPSKRRTSKLL
ncbi:Protein BLISTER [Cardamine amara subsp. amara]|uniref:Protein BLISTER n=1 Tax=Cardamine amara subsp. amara TaxID=228776 RepID=A0ABD0Z724_CARAN